MEYSAGIDLGGTFTKLALVGSDGIVLSHKKVPSLIGAPVEDLLSQLRCMLEEMCAGLNLPYPPHDGCGIGVPGVVDYRSGTVQFSGVFGWTALPLRDLAENVLGCRVDVDTDVNAGMLSDLYFGNACNSSEMLYVSWGTGVGAAFAVTRHVYHSRNGAMGNFGHILAVPNSTRRCFCGLQGCLEVEIGARSLVEKAQHRLLQEESSLTSRKHELTSEIIANAAKAGDHVARQIVCDAAGLLARALSASLALLNPDTVVIAGGVSGCLPIVRDFFDRELARNTASFILAGTTVCHSAFGDAAGVIGAAKLAALRGSK